MDPLPSHLRPLEFDHDAAFRAGWAIDELIRRIDEAAEHRAGVAARILGPAEGPYADHLRYQIHSAGINAGYVVAELRGLQRQIEDAREAALIEDVRRQLAAQRAVGSAAAVPTWPI